MITPSTGKAIQSRAKSLYRHAVADYGFSVAFVVVTVLCLFTPSHLFFQQFASYTLHIMLLLLLGGFIFFLVRRERLMVTSFLCCCVLCLHLKSTANNQLRLAQVTTNPALRVSHINLANAENDYDSLVNYILRLPSDFISFQELTPDWNAQLTNRLSGTFGYIHTMTRLDQYGMGFFSKLPFRSIDTVYYNNVPALICAVEMAGNNTCNIISCQVIPPVNQAAFQNIQAHLSHLADYMSSKAGGMIVLGDMHLPPWSSEIQKFKVKSRLKDSRRDLNPRNLDGSVSLPRIPVDHIFYCDKFQCTSFSELGNAAVGKVGITGTYQLNESYAEMAH